MIYNFESEFNEESFEEFLDVINGVDPEEQHTLLLCSVGGQMHYGRMMSEILNERKDFWTIHAYGEICSTAFLVFMEHEGNKKVSLHTNGMFHKGSFSPTFRTDGSTAEYVSLLIEETKNNHSYYLDKLKDWNFTEEQIALYAEGKDVLIPYNQLKSYEFTHERKTIKQRKARTKKSDNVQNPVNWGTEGSEETD